MVKRTKDYPVPKFHDLKEEEEFWRTHSPLTEGFEGKIQRNKQQRNSFLSIRLTGEELNQLRERATIYRMTPSAYARKALLEAIEEKPNVPGNLLSSSLFQEFVKTAREQDSSFDNIVREAILAASNYFQKEKEVLERALDLYCKREREDLGKQDIKK